MYNDEWEEETTYIAFDLGKNTTTDFIDNVSRAEGGCRIIGLEEGEPYLQLGDLIFEGQVDETMGSHLYFEIEERKSETVGLLPLLSSIREEEVPKPQRYTANYKFTTETTVTMEPITLIEKTNEPVEKKNIVKEEEDDDSYEPMIL